MEIYIYSISENIKICPLYPFLFHIYYLWTIIKFTTEKKDELIRVMDIIYPPSNHSGALGTLN